VLDWMMPELEGSEVLARLRAGDDETPVLMLTARDAIKDRVEGLEGGAERRGVDGYHLIGRGTRPRLHRADYG
jgi:CheY-like chemotaxis protein